MKVDVHEFRLLELTEILEKDYRKIKVFEN